MHYSFALSFKCNPFRPWTTDPISHVGCIVFCCLFSGKGPIPNYLRITVDGIAKELSTKRSCDPNRWNSSAEKVSGTREDAKALNTYLDTLQAKA